MSSWGEKIWTSLFFRCWQIIIIAHKMFIMTHTHYTICINFWWQPQIIAKLQGGPKGTELRKSLALALGSDRDFALWLSDSNQHLVQYGISFTWAVPCLNRSEVMFLVKTSCWKRYEGIYYFYPMDIILNLIDVIDHEYLCVWSRIM